MLMHHRFQVLVLLLLQVAVAFGQAEDGAAPATKPKVMDLGQVKLSLLSAAGSSVINTQGTYPSQLLSSPQVSSNQALEVSLSPKVDGAAFKPQQVFISLQQTATGAAAYAVGKLQKSGGYAINAPLSIISKQIGRQAGEYKVLLLIGDPSVSNSVQWELGVVELVLEQGEQAEPPAVRTVRTQPVSNAKPVITHIFRAPDKRPPATVSLAFAGLALAPLLGVVGYVLVGLGVNFKAWPRDATTSLAALCFHGLLAAILCVYLLFWTRWNLAQTLPVVAALGAALALVGHRALSGLAVARASASSKQD